MLTSFLERTFCGSKYKKILTEKCSRRNLVFNSAPGHTSPPLPLGGGSYSGVAQPRSFFFAKKRIEDIEEDDVKLDLTQKGVDMKIGIDICSLAIKKMVNQIILVAGDSDFVPAAKTARREGIDFILDPMWNHINENLYTHIDGLRSKCPKPKNRD